MPGSYDSGEDEFGDALPSPAASPTTTAPQALFFDPATRRHALREDGTFVYIHWVDAAVINALHTARGRFPAVLDTGARFGELESAYDPRAQRKCEDWAREALARLTSAGDATLDGVRHGAFGAYASAIEVSYTNMRLWPRTSKPVVVPLG